MRRPVFHALLVLSLAPSGVFAQAENAGLNVFGYFQVALGYQKDVQTEREQNSFTLQQLNLFLQKKLTQDWTAFVNFEFVNSYSSFFNWGAFSLEEAWINYQRSDQFKLKLGLLTPAFNNLNELKNRTPLLPYVIRPVVYESSFREIIPTEDFVPARAFMQAYGIIPAGDTKFEYALYLGNSPNINSDRDRGVTGWDTSRTFMLGSRVGIRHKFFKAGFSATFDKRDLSADSNALQIGDALQIPAAELNSIYRYRIGGDLSYHSEKWMVAGEFIHVNYDFDQPEINFDQRFYYGTLGYYFSERLFVYASYWYAHANVQPLFDEGFHVPTLGVTYHLNDMIVLKAQSAQVKSETTDPAEPTQKANFDYSFFAVSVVF